MVGCIWMILVLLCSIAIPPIRSQTLWIKKTTSKYELRFYDSKVSNFEAAKTLCGQDAGIVLRTDNEEVRTVVKATIKSASNVNFFWIGAIRSSNSWTWLDESSVSVNILDWKSGQPDNAGKVENCLLIYKETSKYGDIPCLNKYAGTICQRYLAGRYSVRTSNLTLTEGSAKQINCSADGVPVPNVVWKKGKVTIPKASTDGIYQRKYSGFATLRLEHADLSDEGEYKCVASKKVNGTKYKSTATSHLRVPSKPMILSIEPQFCNSSLIVKWKPHARAVGVKHGQAENEIFLKFKNKRPLLSRIRILNETRSRYLQQEDIVTPSRGEQLFISDNLTSSTLYKVEISTCMLCSAVNYSHSLRNYTGGIPQPVPIATLVKRNGSCNANWTWPANTPAHLITGFKVKTKFTTAIVAISTNSATEEIVKVATSLSFIIPNRPNRNHTVIITSQTCAGVGKAVVAKGVCVTDVAAPSSVPKPSADDGKNEIFDDGKLRIKVKVPSQTNGPISCLFVIVEIRNSTETTRFDKGDLAKANGTDNGTRHIAIAMGERRINGTSELQIVLGDKSTTRCNIHSQQLVGRKRDETGDKYADYVGQNTPLANESSYNIYLVTSTPSDATIFFQTSDPLVVKAPGKPIQNSWVIPVVVVIAVLMIIALIVAGIHFKRRAAKNQSLPVQRSIEIEANPTSVNATPIDESVHGFSTTNPTAVNVQQEQVLYENYQDGTKVQLSKFEAYYNRLCREECSIFKSQFKTIIEKAAADMKSSSIAANPEFKKKNRYKNILPFDSTRVVIRGNKTGYINACYINGFNKEQKFIATQGPLPSTVNDFWLMVVENDCKIIVMLTKCFEAGKKKCQKYWPDEGETEHYGKVTVQNCSEVKSCGFVLRTFQISDADRNIQVIQFQYLNWPDHGIPKTTSVLVRMHKAVVRSWKEEQTSSPIIVHCSAGAGRTGTFIGYDFVLEQAAQDDQVDVMNCILQMRSQRVDMVQNCDQYIMVHKLLLEHYLFADTDLESNKLTQKVQDMYGRASSTRELSKEFENLSRLAPVESTSIKEISGDSNAIVVIVMAEEMVPPKLNAAWIESYDENSPMIAARAPERDVSIFWRAICDNRVNTIVMLSGANEHQQYWPDSTEETLTLHGVSVCLLTEISNSTIVERTLQISKGSKQCIVTQYHYSKWDETDCPDDSRFILELVDRMQKNTRKESEAAALIHCSDGVGRTGTFCAIVNLIERLKTESRVDVFRVVKDLRDCRPGMLRTLDQYVFCHRVINDYLKSFDIYSNFG